MEPVRNNVRDLEVIVDQEKIQHLLKKYLANNTMYVKGGDPPAPVVIAGFNDLNILSVDMGQLTPGKDEELTLFRILGRYMHVQGVVIGPTGQGNLYTMQLKTAAIARMERSSQRFLIRQDEACLTNFRASKHSIDATLFNIPTSVKVNFSTVEQTLKAQHDFVKIDVFSGRGSLLDEVRKTGRSALLTDTREIESYRAPGEGYLDYHDALDDALRKTMEEYRRGKIISEIIVPVIYITHDLQSIPLGYIRVQSRSKHYTTDDVLQLREMAFQLVDRIRDSNTVFIQERQELINLSRGGLKCIINHPELREYLERQNGFTFDLLFKLQAPITLYGTIRGAYKMRESGDLILAVQISGSSSRGGEIKRFEEYVAKLEARHKEQLARQQSDGKTR
ncbi:MAG: DUF1577 domain-containing protein [Leptospirales bacterium]|nr:DUF1577 domain-containing protein [Leptospirales bacterium]